MYKDIIKKYNENLKKKDIIKFKLPIEDSNRCIIKYKKTKKRTTKLYETSIYIWKRIRKN